MFILLPVANFFILLNLVNSEIKQLLSDGLNTVIYRKFSGEEL